jgi:hypothetical protein
MIEKKLKNIEQQDKITAVRHADIKAAVYNAPLGPMMKKGMKFPYTPYDFLPKDMRPKRQDVSEKGKNANWLAAGQAMMQVVKEHEHETGVKP